MSDPPSFPDLGGGTIADPVLQQQLLDQRRILLAGPLDASVVASVSGQLLVLDGVGDGPVDIVVNSAGGPLDDIFGVVDLIAALRSPVNVICIGSASGTAVALVAGASGQRRAARHARFCLRVEPAVAPAEGDLVRRAEERRQLERRYVAFLAGATNMDGDRIGAELVAGDTYGAEQAVEFGIVDAIVG